jgi:GLPGLI family protein
MIGKDTNDQTGIVDSFIHHNSFYMLYNIIRSLSLGLLLVVSSASLHAQQKIITFGKIEYEKKVNMHKYIEDNSWSQEFKDRMPVYQVSYHNLIFDSTSSVFKAGKENPDDKWKSSWGGSTGEENITYQNFSAGSITALKQVFEKKFMVQDSLLDIEWRITDETRTIAGFDCRKAVGKMYDSLYVIAFYTDQIVTPSGPEQYNGLPGTILGLAFPRFYTTWFATKVELIAPKPEEIKAPVGKATKINRKELMAQVRNVYNWGSEESRQKYFWNTVL